MKHIILLSAFLLIIPAAKAQRYTDFGLLAGGAYYMGEINPTRQFYSIKPSLGGFFRWNINKRFAARLSGYYLTLTGSDLDFPDRIHPERPNTTFSNPLVDFSAQAEFYFLPYITAIFRFFFFDVCNCLVINCFRLNYFF